jgi:hypothetical protein
MSVLGMTSYELAWMLQSEAVLQTRFEAQTHLQSHTDMPVPEMD